MLEAIMKTMGKYVVGGIAVFLAFVFALQFGGPQAQGCTSGGARSVVAAEVYGQKITLGEYRASAVILNVSQQDPDILKANRMDEAVLDGLVDRVLLAREARKLGLHVSEEDALAKLLDTRSVRASIGISAPASYRTGGVEVPFLPKDEKLEDDFVKNAIQNRTRRSVSEFAKAQAEELLAERMREVIRSSVRVSPAEVWDAYVAETDKVDLDYVRFAAAHYRDALTFTPAEIDAWIGANTAAVDKAYEAEKHRYTGLDKQVRARQILVAWAAEDDAAKAAAKTEADALARKAKAGADFASLASASSDDEDTKTKGGDLGYTPVGRRPEPFDATVFALKAGEVSDAVEGPGGYFIFKAEAFREGDVPLEEAKREIAERLIRDEKAESAAKAAAEKALARLQTGVTFEALDRELAGLRALKAGESAPEDEKDPREGKDSAPRHESTGSFGRGDAPLGPSSAELTKIAFALTEADALSKAPIQIGRDFVVYRLKTRDTASQEGFTAETKARINEELRLAKGDEAVRLYVASLRDRAKKENELVVDIQAVRAPAGDGPKG